MSGSASPPPERPHDLPHELQHALEDALHAVEERIPFYLRRWWRWPAIAIAAIVVPIAIGLVAFRLIAPQVPGYKAEVEQRASLVIGAPVAIDDMYLSWWWFGPEVVLRKVRVLAPAGAGELFGANAVRVAVSPLDFLRGGPWRPGRVLFEKPVVELTITPDQRILLGGTEVGDLTQPTADWRGALDTLLTHGHLEALGLALTWHDQRRLDGPLAFVGDIALDTDGEEHELELELALPAVVGAELHVEGTAVGRPGAPEAWTWDAQLRARGIQVGWLRTRLAAGEQGGFDGELDIEATTAATGARLDRFSGRVRMGDLRAAGASAGAGGTIDALESGVEWRRVDAGWSLDLDRLQVRRGQRVWQPGGLTLGFGRDDATGGTTLTANAGFLRVEDLELIASWLPERVLPFAARLHRFAPRGEVTGLRLMLQFAEARVLGYELHAEFDELGFDPVDRIPGARGLSGRLAATQDGGTLALGSQAVSLDFDDLFRGPLAAQSMGARVEWNRSVDGWQLRAEDLSWRSPDVRLAGRAVVNLPAAGTAPVVDVELEVRDAVSTNLPAYLPVRVMTPQLVAWLERAIVRGRAPRGEIVLQGPLDRFPFRAGEGLFQIKFHADDSILEYGPEWPRIEAISADVTFRNAGLEIVASQAEVGGAVSRQARAWIPDLWDPVVHVEGRIAATAEQGHRFIAASPLKQTLSAYLEAIQVEGPMEVALALAIPVRRPEAVEVDVRTAFAGARVAVVGLPLAVEEVAGEVRFTRDAIASERLSGRLFGAPLVATIAPPPPKVAALARLAVEGGAEVRELARALELPLERFMRGRAALRAEIDLPRQRGEALTVALRSDLKGVAVDLPAPFGKAAAAATPVRGSLRFGGDALGARIDYAGGSSALYSLRREKRGWALAPGESAAHVTVVAPLVDLDAWLDEWSAVINRPDPRPAARRPARAPAGTAATELPLRRLDVRAKQMKFVGSLAADASITARRDGPGWQAEVVGTTIAGSIAVPDDRASQPIVLDMDRLWIAEDAGVAAAAPPTSAPAADPRALPGFEVRAASLRLAGSDLGKVEATIEKRPTGLFLTRFQGDTLTHKADATGRWEWTEGGSRTSIAGKLISTDVRVTLTELGIAAPLEAERARIEADVAWPGAPWDRPFARMGGTLKVRIGKGQLIDLAPGGAGRFVGLMSLQALPRRLRLDFSDVFKKGFGFDSIEGDFVVEAGNAYTQGARIKGPAATVTVIGRAGFEAQDYDQLAIVDTGLGSTLPVAGAIAGGLTGGAVMLLFAQVFKSPLQDATRARYRITGPWGDPKIEQVAAKAALPATAPPTGGQQP